MEVEAEVGGLDGEKGGEEGTGLLSAFSVCSEKVQVQVQVQVQHGLSAECS
jgi:hypothetical protein